MHTAMFWHAADDGKIECGLCPHSCRMPDNGRGVCGVRLVSGAKLCAAGYGLISSAHNDPIEKKPLYHFHPGAQIFSIGGWGCNFKCKFCQNWTISQETRLGGRPVRPDEIISAARSGESIGVAYTYNEPLINIEFVADCARLAREAGLVNVLVTNGYVLEKPAAFILPLVDALNIDIKSMDDGFYRQQCAGALKPVLDFSRQAVAAGCHVEITNLIIPGLNDGDEQIKKLAEWIRANLGENTPLHFSAYRPEFKMDLPPTPSETIERACLLCKGVLPYVYAGNVRSESGQNTRCPRCGTELIVRRGYGVHVAGIREKSCARCGRAADIVMNGKKTTRWE